MLLNGTPLTEVDKFTYLGSTISNNGSIDAEIMKRIQSVTSAFEKLRSRLWDQRGIHLKTKMKDDRAIVIPTLLYSSETWTLYRSHIKRLDQVQQRHLRQLMNISWKIMYHILKYWKRQKCRVLKKWLPHVNLGGHGMSYVWKTGDFQKLLRIERRFKEGWRTTIALQRRI